MVTYELYINNVLCDIGEDENITLQYDSPVFSELDAITSNHSFVINLPLTINNRKAISNACRADILNDAPYIKLPAQLYRNGVSLIQEGYAIIDEIADAISCTLVWGNIEAFEELFNTNLSELHEQLEAQGNSVIRWDDNIYWGSETEGEGVKYIRTDFGVGVVIRGTNVASMEFARPSIRVENVIRAITAKCGIEFSFEEENKNILDLWLPLVENKNDNTTPALTGAFDTVGNADQKNVRLSFLRDNTFDYAGLLKDDEILDLSSKEGGDIKANVSAKGEPFHIQLNISYSSAYKPEVFFVVIGSDGNLEYSITSSAGSFASEGANHSAVYEFAPIETIVGDYSSLRFELHSNEIFYLAEFLDVEVEIRGAFKEKKLLFPGQIPVASNLPSMSCGEFIQNLMNMFGLFAQIKSSGNVSLFQAKTLYDSIEGGEVLEWSDRLVINDRKDVSMANSIRYTIDGWAQKNILTYDIKEDIGYNPSGEIYIENQNIEKTKEIKIDFVATNNDQKQYAEGSGLFGEIATIPLYDNIENANAKSVGARILSLMQDPYDNIYDRLIFPERLMFGGEYGLVNTYYAAAQKILKRPKVINVLMRLSMIDLMALDWSKPVYLSQYGSYFAIYKIVFESTGLSEVDLIKLL